MRSSESLECKVSIHGFDGARNHAMLQLSPDDVGGNTFAIDRQTRSMDSWLMSRKNGRPTKRIESEFAVDGTCGANLANAG